MSGIRKLSLKVTQSVGTEGVLPVWLDARVRRAPWLLERLEEKEKREKQKHSESGKRSLGGDGDGNLGSQGGAALGKRGSP